MSASLRSFLFITKKVCLYIRCLSVPLSIYFYIHLKIYPSICSCLYQSIHHYLYIHVSPSISLIYISRYLFLSIDNLFVSISISI